MLSLMLIFSVVSIVSCRNGGEETVPTERLNTPINFEKLNNILFWGGDARAINGYTVSINGHEVTVSVNQLRLNDHVQHLIYGENIIRVQARATNAYLESNFSDSFRFNRVRDYEALPVATQDEWNEIVNRTVSEFAFDNQSTNYSLIMTETLRMDDLEDILPLLISVMLDGEDGGIGAMIEMVLGVMSTFGMDLSSFNLGTHGIHGEGNSLRQSFALNSLFDGMMRDPFFLAMANLLGFRDMIDMLNNSIDDMNNVFATLYNNYLVYIEPVGDGYFIGEAVSAPDGASHPLGATMMLGIGEEGDYAAFIFNEFISELKNLANFTQVGSRLTATDEALSILNDGSQDLIGMLLSSMQGGEFLSFLDIAQNFIEISFFSIGHSNTHISTVSLTLDIEFNIRDILEAADLDQEEIDDFLEIWGERDDVVQASIDIEINLSFGNTTVVLPERSRIFKIGIDTIPASNNIIFCEEIPFKKGDLD